MLRHIIALSTLALALAAGADRPIKVVLVGDSTVNDEGGWGPGFRFSLTVTGLARRRRSCCWPSARVGSASSWSGFGAFTAGSWGRRRWTWTPARVVRLAWIEEVDVGRRRAA